MNKNAKKWLFVMIAPFFIGVIIHFLVPLEITVSVNPKLEGIFNGFKIEVEQNTVRALTYLNGRILTNRLQTYENMRSTFTRMIFLNDISQNLTTSADVHLHNARNSDVLTSNTTNLNSSMWYSPLAATLDEIQNSSSLLQILNRYKRSEPFIRTMMKSSLEIFQPIISIETTLFHKDEYIYFQYPSEDNPIFKNSSEDVLNRGFSKAKKNKISQNFSMTILNNGKFIKLCSIVNWNVTSEPFSGSLCFTLRMKQIIRDLTSELDSTEFELSSNYYYLLRPIYEFEKLDEPQIVANFSSNNFSCINIPVNAYFNLTENPLNKSLFSSRNKSDYQLNIQRHEKTNTYYTIPIMLYADNQPSAEVGLYLVVLNNFAKAVLSEESTSERIQLIMITPSVLVFLASLLILVLVMRAIMRELGQSLSLMREYCSLMKRGDLELEISDSTKTQDLKDIFTELDVVNQLNKYSDLNYFKVSKPERITRFLKCLKLYEKLGYDRTNLYENISSCYLELKDYENAIKFLKDSIDLTIKELYGNENQIDVHYQAKLENPIKNHKNWRKREKILKRKVLNLCKILREANEISKSSDNSEIFRLAEMLRKISYPDILNEEYISCLFFILSCKLKNGDLEGMEDKMEILRELIQGYEEFSSQQTESSIEVPPEIFESSWFSLFGFWKMRQGQLPLAFKYFIKSLKSNRFNPVLHTAVHVQMENILNIYGIPKEELRNMKFMDQYKNRTEKEFIFMIDVGKPSSMNLSQINSWKKSARKMGEHIFNRHIQATDRMSITEFCLDIKVICNLIEKGNREHLLKKEMMSSIKARDQTIEALLMKCLKKSIERTKVLKKEKVFIIFYKGGIDIDVNALCESVSEVENASFLLFSQNRSIVDKKNEEFHFIDFEDTQTVNRILDEKVFKPADNIVSIL